MHMHMHMHYVIFAIEKHSLRLKAGSQYDAKQRVALRQVHDDACRNTMQR